ncbi:MAG: hypothetical protein ACK41D_01165 [Rubricoccaceae bacterium]
MPPPFRVRLTVTDGTLVYEMPPVRSAGALARSAAQLALWAVLFASVADAAASGAVPGALAAAAGALVVAGAVQAALRAGALHLVREHLVLTHDRLEYVQACAGRLRVRRFARAHVRDVRAEQASPLEGPLGRVAFSFGAATVRFGRGLTESEARIVAERFRQALEAPQNVPARTGTGAAEAGAPAWIARPANASSAAPPDASVSSAAPPDAPDQASKSAALRTASADCTRALSMRANLFPN